MRRDARSRRTRRFRRTRGRRGRRDPVGRAVALSVEAASDQGTPASYTVDWGDDVVDAGTQSLVRHVYPTAGRWPLRVTVKDADGVSHTSGVCEAESTAVPASVNRLGGYTRYDTSAAISQFVWASVGPDGYVPDPDRRQAHAVVLTSGTDFPDALAAGPVATSGYETEDGRPAAVVLSDGASITDPATAAYVRARLGFVGVGSAHPPTHAEAIGGAAALALYQLDTGQRRPSPLILGCDTAGRTSSAAPVPSGAGSGDFVYVAGVDRYATAACLTLAGNHGEPGGANTVRTIALTNGTAYTDALTGAAAIATLNGSVLLTQKDEPPSATVGGLKLMYDGAVDSASLDIFGDEGVVSAGVQAQAQSYMP